MRGKLFLLEFREKVKFFIMRKLRLVKLNIAGWFYHPFEESFCCTLISPKFTRKLSYDEEA
jgi:hypothetical protein